MQKFSVPIQHYSRCVYHLCMFLEVVHYKDKGALTHALHICSPDTIDFPYTKKRQEELIHKVCSIYFVKKNYITCALEKKKKNNLLVIIRNNTSSVPSPFICCMGSQVFCEHPETLSRYSLQYIKPVGWPGVKESCTFHVWWWKSYHWRLQRQQA